MRLRPLSEAEAYARCYGEGDDNVRFVKLEPRRPRFFRGVSGEDLRRAFESRLSRREPEPLSESSMAAPPAGEPVSDGHEPAAAA
ncbi:MAG TPA: hypothetical protein VH420_01705 [Gaiellaceae bacterium]|jgi:hypothetical protein